jgi:putative hydrolase of HD superfamily
LGEQAEKACFFYTEGKMFGGTLRRPDATYRSVFLNMKEREMEKNQQLERLEKQIRFIVEIDKVKNIFRQTYLADAGRKENDAEHSWHIALMAYLLQEYAEKPVDVSKVMLMVLIHDLVEIDAGDTYAYDDAGAETKRAREEAAADRIFGLLPEDQGKYFRELWEEFEAYESPEGKYAHLLDNFQPLLLNDASGGLSWQEHQVRKSQIYKRNEKIEETSETIWNCMKEIVQKHIECGHVEEDCREE